MISARALNAAGSKALASNLDRSQAYFVPAYTAGRGEGGRGRARGREGERRQEERGGRKVRGTDTIMLL